MAGMASHNEGHVKVQADSLKGTIIMLEDALNGVRYSRLEGKRLNKVLSRLRRSGPLSGNESLADEVRKLYAKYLAMAPAPKGGYGLPELSKTEIEDLFVIYAQSGIESVQKRFGTVDRDTLRQLVKQHGCTRNNPFPPHILESMDADECNTWLMQKRRALAQHELVKTQTARMKKDWRKMLLQVEQVHDTGHAIQQLVAEACEKLNKAETLPADIMHPGELGKTLYVALSDIHFGKCDTGAPNCYTDKDILHDRLIRLADKVVRTYKLEGCFQRLCIIIGGDILETIIPDGMHEGQTHRMDLEGAEQVAFAVRSLNMFIRKIAALATTHVHIIGGNHDRIGKTREDDIERTGSAIVAAMLNLINENEGDRLHIVYHKLGVISIEDPISQVCPSGTHAVNTICFHGDNKLKSRSPAELIGTFAKDPKAPCMIISGHLHHFKSDSHQNWEQVQLGPVCSSDSYEFAQYGSYTNPSAMIYFQEGGGIEIRKIPLV